MCLSEYMQLAALDLGYATLLVLKVYVRLVKFNHYGCSNLHPVLN